MSKGYGVFGHVPDNADDDGLLPYEDDDSGVSWGHALRRRNPWKRGDDEDADYDDGRYDIDDTDDTNGGRGIYAGKSGGVGGISGETGGILGSSGAAGSRDVTFGGTDSLSAADAVEDKFLPLLVKLRENIVQQEYRIFPGLGEEYLPLGKLH